MEAGRYLNDCGTGMFSVPILRLVLYPMKKLSDSDFKKRCFK